MWVGGGGLTGLVVGLGRLGAFLRGGGRRGWWPGGRGGGGGGGFGAWFLVGRLTSL